MGLRMPPDRTEYKDKCKCTVFKNLELADNATDDCVMVEFNPCAKGKLNDWDFKGFLRWASFLQYGGVDVDDDGLVKRSIVIVVLEGEKTPIKDWGVSIVCSNYYLVYKDMSDSKKDFIKQWGAENIIPNQLYSLDPFKKYSLCMEYRTGLDIVLDAQVDLWSFMKDLLKVEELIRETRGSLILGDRYDEVDRVTRYFFLPQVLLGKYYGEGYIWDTDESSAMSIRAHVIGEDREYSIEHEFFLMIKFKDCISPDLSGHVLLLGDDDSFISFY